MNEESQSSERSLNRIWRFARIAAVCTVIASILACFYFAIIHGEAITHIHMTASSFDDEPRDHALPFVKQEEALPDYQIVLRRSDGSRVYLDCKQNESAVEGLQWKVKESVAIHKLQSIQLLEVDKVVNDVILEFPYSKQHKENGYEFSCKTAVDSSTVMYAFFDTPIGKAICLGFCIAIIVIVLSNLPIALG